MSKFEVKDKVRIEVVLIDSIMYQGRSYHYYDDGIRYIHKFLDDEGNIYIYRCDRGLGIEFVDKNGYEGIELVEVGDKVFIGGSVKEISEYKGEEQTVLSRVKIYDIVEKQSMSEEDIVNYKKNVQLSKYDDVEIKTVRYKEYKEQYSDKETVVGSFVRNDNGCFIDIIM